MKLKSNSHWWLLLIILLAAILRLSFLGSAPNTFSTDEASNGYDAYSILLTGRDRYGDWFPVLLRGFNDARESLYVYLIIPGLKLFGLNEFTTRFPSAIAGIAIVPIVFYLAQELWQQTKVSLGAALLVAISPWSIYFSRLAFRANLMPVFVCLGLLLFLRSWRQPYYLIFSSICFGISLQTYAAARAFTPLLMLGLIAICYRKLLKQPAITAISALIFLGFILFLGQFWLSPAGTGRVDELGFETNPVKLAWYYLSYLEPVFLFGYGDFNVRRSVTTIGIGQLYLWEMFSVVTGWLALKKQATIQSKILWLWLFLYPIPAALTEEQHAIRSIIGMPLFAMVSSYGFWLLYSRLMAQRKYRVKNLLIVAIALSFMGHLGAYQNYALNKISNTSAGHWQYGMREAISYAERSDYRCVVMSNKFKRSNIYILFYSQYSPSEYQKAPHDPEAKYFTEPTQLGKYTIADLASYQPQQSACLWIAKPNEVENFQQKHSTSKLVRDIQTPKGKSKIVLLDS